MIRAPGPGGSVRLIHFDGPLCVVRPEAVATLETILGRTEVAAPGPPCDALLAALMRQRLIRLADDGHGSRGGPRAALADRLLGGALACAARVRDPARRVQLLLHAARWSMELFGWAQTVRVWERRYPQPTVAAGSPVTLDAIDRQVRRAAAHSLAGHRCKERALACLALARASGHRADLVVGVSDFPVAAHVWTESVGRVFSDEPAQCAGFRPIARFAGDGVARDA